MFSRLRSNSTILVTGNDWLASGERSTNGPCLLLSELFSPFPCRVALLLVRSRERRTSADEMAIELVMESFPLGCHFPLSDFLSDFRAGARALPQRNEGNSRLAEHHFYL